MSAFPEYIPVPKIKVDHTPPWLSQDICSKVILRSVYGNYLSVDKSGILMATKYVVAI